MISFPLCTGIFSELRREVVDSFLFLDNWKVYKDYKCPNVNIQLNGKHNPVGSVTPDQCKSACKNNPLCTGAQYRKSDMACFLKKTMAIDKCFKQTGLNIDFYLPPGRP